MLFTTFLLASIGHALVASTSSDPGYDCRPGQTCWPSQQEWQHLNQTMSGHLHQTTPLAAPCYTHDPFFDTVACDVVKTNYSDSIPRGSSYGETYWLNWETCGTSGCSLLSTDPNVTIFRDCSLGRLAPYYVEIHNASDISAALKFAHTYNVRISIKNTGHDYFGRSTVPNSLALWTHNLQTLDFFSNFTAFNCPSANGQNIGEMGAGVVAGDAYRYFNSHGMDITGGYEQSVGIAGGFGQGGGVGSYTTSYGLMVDNAVEFEVVTADGEVRTVNQCNDPDLFWAMRGGGGGTYAVLTKYRVQVYPSVPIHTYNFIANFTIASSDGINDLRALRDIMTAHAQSQLDWSEQLVTGQVDYYLDGASFGIVLPYGDDGSKLRSATASFHEFVNNRTDLVVLTNNYTSYPSYADYLAVTAVDAKKTEPAGIYSILSARLIPRTIFTTAETIEMLVDAVVEGMIKARSLLDLTAVQVELETPVSNLDSQQMTSAHPAWRNSLWNLIHVGEWFEPLDPVAHENATTGFLQILDPLKEMSPGGGAYVNEAHFEEPDWEETFFGSNYDRLLEVKNKYDPTHLFDCWKCVGWRGIQDPFYSCYEQW